MREDYWINPFDEAVNPGASQELINQVESTLGVKLPEDYLRAMRLQNGGWLRYCIYCLPDPIEQRPQPPPADPPCYASPCYIDLNTYCPIEKLMPLLTPHEEGWDIRLDNLHLLIIFWRDGPSFLCFDYRESGPQGEPSIVFINVDQGKEQPLEQPVASSFKISSKEVNPRTYGQ